MNRTDAAILAVAGRHRLHFAELAAVVRVESSGRPFVTVGGREVPVVRFEHHVFFRELPEHERGAAIRDGLAAERWTPSLAPTRLADAYALLMRAADWSEARGLGREPAMRAASYGLLQVMGFNAQACDYPSAQAMHDAAQTVEGQLEMGVRFAASAGLLTALRAQDWRRFAHGWNGPAYERHGYHVRLARAYAEFSSGSRSREVLRAGAHGAEVEALQRSLGVEPDGRWGPATEAAVRGAQAKAGLVVDGIVGARTWAVLDRMGAEVAAVPEQPVKTDGEALAETATRAGAAAASLGSAVTALAGDDPTLRLALLGVAVIAAALWFAPAYIRRVRDSLAEPTFDRGAGA